MAGQGQGAAAQVDRHRKAQTQSRREAQDVLKEAACEARAWLDARYQGPIGLMSYIPSALSRRRFVEHLFRSPLVLAGTIAAQSPTSPPIESSGDALDVFDFAPSAQGKMSPAHWAYLMTGVDDNLTRDLNHDAFQLLQIRPRRFVDVEKIDTSVQIFGQRHPSPIVIDPVGSQRAFHSDGELATARAAHALGNQMILSTVTTTPLRDVAREYQRPLWYQLYASNDWGITKGLIQKAEEAGCPVLMVTVDTLCGGNRETVARAGRRGEAKCKTCHEPGLKGMMKEHPMYDGLDVSKFRGITDAVTWQSIDRIRELTRMKIVVKGVMASEDAQLCVEHGLDGIVVSNHGGRQEETLLSTIEVLPEIVNVVKGRIPVLIDGGFRRGTDVFKALAIGATAIGIGRPYIWGLGAFGQQGVERVLELMQAELVMVMKQAGATAIGKITPEFVRRRSA
jgi:4-hydroxymandelate oxidase